MPPEKTPKRRNRAYSVSPSEQVLVAVMNNRKDFLLAQDAHWYRIPVKSAPRCINAQRIAFYQTLKFGSEGLAIHWWAEVIRRVRVKRRDLFPEEADHPRADEEYWKLELGALQRLSEPIISHRPRRIIFIGTTWAKFQRAREINDLYHESPLEDDLWEQFKMERLTAERQYYEPVRKNYYALDFALFCVQGKIDVECDGDTWHTRPDRIPEDNARNNDLESQGWHVLRFNTHDIENEMPKCVRTVRDTLNRYGGLRMPDGQPQWFATGDAKNTQLNLFQESGFVYNADEDTEAGEET